MIEEANRFCFRLWKDESGVILALTLVVFLTLFVMACSVYAIGENIRQRIELQNAADAAAYSAAVVQADTVSRIAAINKAMAWTYVQMCKRHMDYVVNEWLKEVVSQYRAEQNAREQEYAVLNHGRSHCDGYRRKKWWIGDENHHLEVWLNRSQWEPINNIENEVEDFPDLSGDIENDRDTIKAMNDAEENLVNELPERVKTTVMTILRANANYSFSDLQTSRSPVNIRFSLLNSVVPYEECFDFYNEEAKFLEAANATSEDLNTGHDTWFPPQPPPTGLPWSRFREYVQWGDKYGGTSADALLAEWKSHVEGWRSLCWSEDCGTYGCRWKTRTYSDHWGKTKGITADDVRDDYFETCEVKPLRLVQGFFSRPGTIVVGLARPIRNPFSFLSDGSDEELFGAFSLPGGSGGLERHMWAVAAARAGINDSGRDAGSDEGEGLYNSSIDSWEIIYDGETLAEAKQRWQSGGWVNMSSRNLKETDWDAILLPLTRAWTGREAAWADRSDAAGKGGYELGRWYKSTSSEILSELWESAEWSKLDGTDSIAGLKTVATGDAPPGMEGNIDLGSSDVDEELVWH